MATSTFEPAMDEPPALEVAEPVLPFAVVGIGGSAGGLEAVTSLLREIPPDTGMSFVYISHLSPSYESHLAEILGRHTSMPTVQVVGEPAIEPNHVYVIPPNRSMHVVRGHLRVQPRDDSHAPHRPIDDFLRSLAIEQSRRAIGVVLSGLGDDGTLGLEEIKGAGGFAFAQDDTALQDSMPLSAVRAGCVDLVLSPGEIAKELTRMARHPYVEKPTLDPAEEESQESIARILGLLHSGLGVDFTSYKRNTVYRRITRRMVLHRFENLSQYEKMLASDPVELEALFQDILINVTRFFRNPEAFERIKSILPEIMTTRPRQDPVRIWVIGCATGEEAYSLAITCREFAQEAGRSLPVQIFATDLSAMGIEKARSGIYSKHIADDVSPERLRRFFQPVDSMYRVSKEIREMCVFARHNGLVEPPFSRMDLVSCRNMLIYLDRNLQKKLFKTLHYALKPDGYLWLGNSESIGTSGELFEIEDPKLKIYKKKRTSTRLDVPVKFAPLQVGLRVPAERPSASPANEFQKEADRILLARFAPAGVLVNHDLEILQFRGDTSPYLAPAAGKASLSLFKMLREGLVMPVRDLLRRAVAEDATVRERQISFSGGSRTSNIAVEVIPLRTSTQGAHFLVLFEDPSAAGAEKPRPEIPVLSSRADHSPDIERLTRELSSTREYLQSVIEQQEAANNELQSANEEVQSANEELQSINEELETTKEEIQSSNEELATVNEELQTRNVELAESNSDMLNLLASVRLPLVMLGADLKIRSFTPMAERLLNLEQADLGRPIGDIRLNLRVEDIETLVSEVIGAVSFREVDVQDQKGHWYSLRIQPYHTSENVIEGAVLVLVDIDTLKRARRYAEEVIAAVAEPLLVLDPDLTVKKGSDHFYQAFELEPDDVEGAPFFQIGGGHWDVPELRRALDTVRYLDARMLDFEFRCEDGNGELRTMLLNAQRLSQEEGHISIVLTIKDISVRKRFEKALAGQVEELAVVNRRQNEFLATLAHELRNPLAVLNSGSELLELSDDHATGAATQGMMKRQISHMSRMIDDLLDVSRINSGKIQLRLEPLDLSRLVREYCKSMRAVLEGQGMDLRANVCDSPVFVAADAVRVEQILGNLLSNASKFSRGSGRVEVKLRKLGGENHGSAGLALLSVGDDGVGMAAEMIPRVFEPFMQVQPSSGSMGGLGIGLTLVRHLVEFHRGGVEAFSEGLGKGSRFEIRIPLSHEPSVEASDGADAKTTAEAVRRVLVVDDNVHAADSLAVLLHLSGHEVRTVYDGESALEVAATFEPDAILLDIGLPGMNGYEVARRLRQLPRPKRPLLLALTGYGQDEDRRRSAESGFDRHLLKPVDLEHLEAALVELSDGTRRTH